jgi:hypothetical protein
MAMSENKELAINIPFTFRRKPISLPAELRPDWKMATLLLILRIASHGSKSSLKRLHVMNWATRSPKFRAEFESALMKPLPLFGLSVRFEPAFSRAIDLAVGEGFVNWVEGNRLKLQPKGARWVDKIIEQEDIMRTEREFLSAMKGKFTEQAASRLLGAKGAF